MEITFENQSKKLYTINKKSLQSSLDAHKILTINLEDPDDIKKLLEDVNYIFFIIKSLGLLKFFRRFQKRIF